MTNGLEILHTLHGLNRWLILLTGTLSVALLLFRNWRKGLEASWPLRCFVGTLHLQVVLGLLMYGLLATQHLQPFGGRPVAWSHMGGGLLTVVLGTLALVTYRRARAPWIPAVLGMIALLGVGKLPIMVILLLMCILVLAVWPKGASHENR